jgi:hypothetical protein
MLSWSETKPTLPPKTQRLYVMHVLLEVRGACAWPHADACIEHPPCFVPILNAADVGLQVAAPKCPVNG